MNKIKDNHHNRQDNKQADKTKKQSNNYKALYQIVKQRKNHIEKSTNEAKQTNNNKAVDKHSKNTNKLKTQTSHFETDSLDNGQTGPELRSSRNKHVGQVNHVNYKKWSHSRSQSCPFMNPPITYIRPEIKHEKQVIPNNNKHIVQNQSKRTLKKISTMHKKNNRINHKYSVSNCEQLSQESNTVIVHSLPIEHLSSMLYSLNHEKQRNFKKTGSNAKLQHHIFSIHTDLYFQTRLQQQIKMYDLNQELRNLHKESQNVRIKQQILQKLANKFDRQDQQTDKEDSLLIH